MASERAIMGRRKKAMPSPYSARGPTTAGLVLRITRLAMYRRQGTRENAVWMT
jgi:hypothetical protein